MNTKSKWIVGITAGTIIVLAVLATQMYWVTPNRYGMMNDYCWSMPMMYGNGMMGGGMFIMWLIGLGTLVFLGLAIAWLVRELTTPKS